MSSFRESVLLLRVASAGRSNFARMSADLRKMNAEGDKFTKFGQRTMATLPHVANILSATGQQAILMGGAMGAGLGIAANEAAKFSTETTLAATQTSNSLAQTKKKTDELMPAIIKQMQKFPATSEEMTKAAYNIFSSLDVNLKGGVGLLNIFNKAAVAGQASLESVAEGGITIMNTFGKSAKQMPDVFNRMFATVRFGRTTFDQLSQAMNTLVPAFQQGNQSVETMLGSFAFLTRKMPNTARASTALARAVEILGRQKFIDNMAKNGVKIADTNGNLLDLETVLTRIRDKFPGLEHGNVQNFLKEMSGTEGTIQARRALTFLFRDLDKGGASFSNMLKRVKGDNNEFGKSFAALNATAGVQWKRFLNQLKAGIILIGLELIPEFVKLGKYLTKGINWFNNLSDGMKKNLAHWAVFGSALAIAGGAALVAASGLTRLLLVVLKLGGAIRATNLLLSRGLFRAAGGRAAIAAEAGTVTAAQRMAGAGALAGVGASPAQANKQMSAWTKLQRNMSERRIAVNRAIIVREMEADLAQRSVVAQRTGAQIMRMQMAQTKANIVGPDVGGARATRAAGMMGAIRSTEASAAAAERAAPKFTKLTPALMKTGNAFKTMGSAAKLAGGGIMSAVTGLTGLGPLGLLVGGTAAAIGYLYYQSTQAKGPMDALTDSQKGLADAANAASAGVEREIKALGGLPAAMVGAAQAREDKRAAQATLKQAQADLKAAKTPAQVASARDKVTIATQGVIAAEGRLTAAQNKANSARQAGNRAIQEQTKQELALQALLRERAQVRQRLDSAEKGGITDSRRRGGLIKTLTDREKELTDQISKQQTAADNAGIHARKQMIQTISTMSRLGLTKKIPKGLAGAVGDQVSRFSQQVGRMPSGKELNKIITIEVKGKGNLDQAQKGIDNLIKKAQGAKPVVNVKAKPDPGVFSAYGHQMGAGLAAGLRAEEANVAAASAALVAAAETTARHQAKVRSPSKLMMDRVGKPLAQGITKGMLKELGGIKAAQKTIVQALISEWDSLKSQMQSSFGDLFTGKQGLAEKAQQGIDFGFKSITSGDVTKDLKDQLNSFHQWRSNLNKLFKRKVPGIDAMRKELVALGPEALPELQALNSMTGKELNNYVKLWKQKQKLINKATHEEFRNQQKMWVAQGRAVAFGILSGLRSGNLDAWMRKQAESMFGSFQKKNKSKSPSRLYEEEGRNMVDGLEQGMQYKQPKFHRAKTHRMKEAAQGHVTNITQHITANKDENLLTTLDKAGFRYRTANR